ncbi:hypothetical protein AC249_AIPGENE8560 [Exaiptasia diaphana]|nr:hypothetical protein AC249_AIPGENE8560 [Exaiptasia diaphana]
MDQDRSSSKKGVIGAFFRKISSSSSTKHQCTTTKAKSSLKSSPQTGKRLVTFAEGTKFDEIIHEEESSLTALKKMSSLTTRKGHRGSPLKISLTNDDGEELSGNIMGQIDVLRTILS